MTCLTDIRSVTWQRLVMLSVMLMGFALICTAQPKPEKPPKIKGIRPRLVREGEAADYGRMTRAPFIRAKKGPGGGDIGQKNAVQLNQSILNWEYRTGYKMKDDWWTRLSKEWYADQLMEQGRPFRLETEQIGAGLRGYWTGDLPISNRGSFEAIQAAKHADYQGTITVDKHAVQSQKSQEASSYQGNITVDKRVLQREKAVQIADWTGDYQDDKAEAERKKAAELSDWTGNYFTNKEEVERKKAEQIADYEGNWFNDTKAKEEKTAKDSRNYKGELRIKNAYLRSHDSKSKYRVIPKGKRDKKEKDLWYD